jgi:hypothetical protein
MHPRMHEGQYTHTQTHTRAYREASEHFRTRVSQHAHPKGVPHGCVCVCVGSMSAGV